MNEHSLVQKIADYVEENLSKDLTLDKISDELHYSKFYIARIFSEDTGCTLYKYIQRRRMTEAAYKLATTDQPIIEVAYEAHYTSQQAFNVAFHQLYFCTPNAYRKNGNYYPIQKPHKTSCFHIVSSSVYRLGGELAA